VFVFEVAMRHQLLFALVMVLQVVLHRMKLMLLVLEGEFLQTYFVLEELMGLLIELVFLQ
jgi:hypothetical protein